MPRKPSPTTPETNPEASQHLIPAGGFSRTKSRDDAAHILTHLADRPVKISGPPLLTLTPNNPFGADGFMYFAGTPYYDAAKTMVYMGPGVIGVVEFTAPADASYAILCNYGGYQAGMNLIGPWGIVVSDNVDYRRDTNAVALWFAAKADKLFFQMNSNSGVVTFHSVEIYRV